MSLISTPGSGHPSKLLGASADGRDVFFYAFSALVPQDQDMVADVYDARIDGGFPASSSVPCSGEGCRLVPSAAPVFGAPQSEVFFGAGNLSPAALVKPRALGAKKKPTKKKSKKKKSKGRKARKAQRDRKARGSSFGSRKANGRGR